MRVKVKGTFVDRDNRGYVIPGSYTEKEIMHCTTTSYQDYNENYHAEHYRLSKKECDYCGQYGQRQASCEHCGAPID